MTNQEANPTRTSARARAVIGIAIGAAATMSGLVLGASPVTAAGPPEPVFNDSSAWACGPEAGVPPFHCINTKSKGKVGNIKVFAPDPRGPQESISTDASFDDRPCPHDPDSPDGTWWEPVPGLWVCHHSGN